jgi:hypothetical protein
MRIRARTSQLLASVMALLPVLLVSSCLADEAGAERENELKAAYLFNFAKFVDWPTGATPDVITVCFQDSAGVLAAFATSVGEKRIGTRRVLVRALTDGTTLDGCDVLYVGSIATDATPPQPDDKIEAVLTVSETHDFIHHGGIIELFPEGNRLRFKISVQNARRAGLKISSSLLQLASSVEGSSR